MRAAIFSAIVLVLGPFGCPDAPAEADAGAADAQASGQEPDEAPVPATPEPSGSEGDGADADPGPALAPGTATLSADPSQSKVGFAVDRAMVGHIGHFGSFDATLAIVDGQPQALEIRIQTASVVADRAGLTSHLKSGDFLDVDKYPTATFTTESIAPQAQTDEPAPAPDAYVVRGTMNMHGARRELEFPATITLEPERALGRATLDISAKAFGISYEGMEAELAEDAVALEIELVFPRVAGEP